MTTPPRPKPERKEPARRPPKPAKEAPPHGANPQLTGQTRKLLGKHYAAKYGKHKGR